MQIKHETKDFRISKISAVIKLNACTSHKSEDQSYRSFDKQTYIKSKVQKANKKKCLSRLGNHNLMYYTAIIPSTHVHVLKYPS